MNKSYKDRKVDKMPVNKSKQYLWKYIKEKKKLSPVEAKEKTNWFAALFVPKRIAWVSAVAVITIIAVLFGPNLQNLLQGGIGVGPQIANAQFEMTADAQDSTGIEPDSTFTLTSSEDLDAALIEANLKSSPETDLNVEKTGESTYKVAAANPLEANTIYNFTIISHNEDGDEEFSWAYQVKDIFKITGTLPGDKTTGVPVNTGIEIYFSHEQFDLNKAKELFEISPAAEGSFEQHQRTLVFVPKGGLKPSTVYTVTLKAGLQLADSDQTITEDKTFAFETSTEGISDDRDIYFYKPRYEVATGEAIGLTAATYQYKPTDDEPLEVEIYKFKDANEYIEALKKRSDIPNWAYYAIRSLTYDTSNLQKVRTYEAIIVTKPRSFIYLPTEDLEPGYYLINLPTEKTTAQALLQVSDLSSYMVATTTGGLTWVHDLNTEKPVNGAKVELIDTGKSFTTNQDGIAEIEFPQLGEEGKSYIVKVSTSEGKSLISELFSYSKRVEYWSVFDTDRPLYQPTDTLHFWGFAKQINTGKPVEDLKVKLYKDWGATLVDEIPVTNETATTFNGAYEFKNLPPGSYELVVSNGDERITSKFIEISNYTKPSYEIDVESSKRAVFADEEVTFSIDSHFFDGTPVPDMQLGYFENKNKSITTDREGKASFTVDTSMGPCNANYCTNSRSPYITVTPNLGEESDIQGQDYVRIFRSKINVDATSEVEGSSATVNLQTNWVDLSRLNNQTNENYNDFLGDVAQNREVDISITEVHWEKIEKGEYYDFINKKVVKEYDSKRIENPFAKETVTTDGEGKGTYTFEMNPEKFYSIRIASPDDDQKYSYDSLTIYGSQSRQYQFYHMVITNRPEDGTATFNIGETVETAISKGDTLLQEEGQYLYMQLNDGLQEYQTSDSYKYSFKFTHDDVPTVHIQGVMFNGKTYVPVWGTTAYYDKELKALEVDIAPTKDSYEPGEKVTLNIAVKDKDGKPAAAEVNVNLVDEAFYKLVYDRGIDPLDDLYKSRGIGITSTYLSHLNPEIEEGGPGKGGCFTEGTQILMADGTYKAIEDVMKNDYILTKKSPYSSELVSARVLNTVSHYVAEYLVINDTLEITSEHILLVNGKFVTAGSIRVSDTLLNKDGEEVVVNTIKKVKKPVMVYNFEVENQHTYFAEDIYVHNDKGGDGIRSDFEDVAHYEIVRTNGSGKASITFQLPDNITSWRVVAQAIDPDGLRAGAGVSNIKVTLPMFADFVMNKEYSVKDSPTIKLRAFGTELDRDDEVEFTVAAPSLGVEKSREMKVNTREAAYYDLPDLTKGVHEITLWAKSDGLEDALQESINVRGSRLKKTVVDIVSRIDETSDLNLPEDVPATVYFMDGGVAGYYDDLIHLYNTDGDRLDQRLSEVIGSELLAEHFEQEFALKREFDIAKYQHAEGGLTLLPYSDPDLRLSALVMAIETNKERYYSTSLKDYFYSFYLDSESNLEEIVLGLLGLASMDEPVLNSLRVIKDEPTLSLDEKLYIGLAFEELGSKNEAKEMFEAVKDELADGNSYETALGAMLASAIQNREDAVELWDYVLVEGIKDDIVNLYMMDYIDNMLEFVSPDPVSFTVRVGNAEEKMDLEGCGVHSVLVSSMKGISVKDIKGDLAAVVVYEDEIEPSAFKGDDRLNIVRSYRVNGEMTNNFKEGDLVVVSLTVNPNDIPEMSYRIVDILPSGLRPISNPRAFGGYNGYTRPYDIQNQEAYFYWHPSNKYTTMRYFAVVISPGEYYADPAKMESYMAPEISNISEADMITIEAR